MHWSYFECLIQHICCVKIIISFCSIAQYSTWLHQQKSLVSAWKKLGSMIAQCVPQCSPPGDIISCTTFNISTDAQCANWLFGKTKCQLQNPKPTCPYHPQVCLQQSQHPGHPHTSHLSQVPTVHYVWSNHITKGFTILQCSSSGLISVDSGIAAMPLLSSVRLSQRISCSGFLLTNKNLQFWKPVYNRTFPLKAGYSLNNLKLTKIFFNTYPLLSQSFAVKICALFRQIH